VKTWSVVSALSLVVLLSGPAMAAGMQHFIGEAVCQTDTLYLDLGLNADGSVRYARRISNTNGYGDRNDGTAERQGATISFRDIKGTISGDGKSIAATMVDSSGEIDPACKPLTLTLLERGPAAHYDELLKVFATPEPTLEQAQRAAELARFRPDVTYLPDVEWLTTEDRYIEKSNAFWKRFWTAELTRQVQLPATTAQDIAALEKRMTAAGADGMSNDDTTVRVPFLFSSDATHADSSGAFVLQMANHLADAKSTAKLPLAPLTFGGKSDACERLIRAGSALSADAIAMIFALPVEYMDVSMQTVIRNEAVACRPAVPELYRSRIDEMVSALDGAKAEIDKRFANRLWLRSELARLAAVPPTLAGFKAANNFELSRDELRNREIDDRTLDRFTRPALDVLRADAFKAAAAEIAAAFAAAVPSQASEASALATCTYADDVTPNYDVQKACEAARKDYVERVVSAHAKAATAAIATLPSTLAGLTAHDGFKFDRSIREKFHRDLQGLAYDALERADVDYEVAAAPARAAATANARKALVAAFDAAKPDDATEVAARQMCSAASKLADGGLLEACNAAQEAYASRRKVMVCDAAIAKLKAFPEPLESRFGVVTAAKGLVFFKGRDLVCKLAELGAAVEFADNSGLFASGLLLKTSMPVSPADGTTTSSPPIVFSLSMLSDSRGKYWRADSATVGGAKIDKPDDVLAIALALF
jgi:hypothetical protein